MLVDLSEDRSTVLRPGLGKCSAKLFRDSIRFLRVFSGGL
jgi:hypothetical protein